MGFPRAYGNFDELAIDVSAFANSEGSLIILGVSEEEKRKIFSTEITWEDEIFSREYKVSSG